MANVVRKRGRTHEHIHAFFRPALTVMNRLAYPRKFAIISLLFALPLVLVMYLLLSEINERIDFARHELHGVAYLRPLQQLLAHMPQAKLLAQAYSQGQVGQRPDLIRKQADIEAAVAALATADQRLGTRLKTTEKFMVLKENWAFLRQQTLSLAASDSAHLYTHHRHIARHEGHGRCLRGRPAGKPVRSNILNPACLPNRCGTRVPA